MAKRSFKFDKMTLSELLQLRDEIETALNGKITMERKELQSKMAELAQIESSRGPRPAGRAVEKSKPHALKGRKAAPKYRGPNGETWAGRGLAPGWLTALEKKGKKREQFLIKQ